MRIEEEILDILEETFDLEVDTIENMFKKCEQIADSIGAEFSEIKEKAADILKDEVLNRDNLSEAITRSIADCLNDRLNTLLEDLSIDAKSVIESDTYAKFDFMIDGNVIEADKDLCSYLKEQYTEKMQNIFDELNIDKDAETELEQAIYEDCKNHSWDMAEWNAVHFSELALKKLIEDVCEKQGVKADISVDISFFDSGEMELTVEEQKANIGKYDLTFGEFFTADAVKEFADEISKEIKKEDMTVERDD